MKKIIALLAAVLTVSGCTLFSPTKDVDSLTGVLSKQDANDTYQGTHLLTEESGDEAPLTSTALNLSSPQYLGNKVNVQGKIDETTGVFEVTGVTVLEVLEKEEGAVKWVEYMNQDVGFKLKYYDNWKVGYLPSQVGLNGQIEVHFYAPSTPNSSCGFDSAANSAVCDAVIISREDTIPPVGNDSQLQDIFKEDVKIGVNQNTAKKYITNLGVESYELTRDNFLYSIGFYPDESDKTDDEENRKIFYEMLAEFQFVPFAENKAEVSEEEEADETTTEEKPTEDATVTPDDGMSEVTEESYDYSDYSEFESLPYKFKSKYPSDWYYAGSTGSGDVLHKYDFSDQPVTDENVFASLEVLSSEMPSAIKKYLGDQVYFYTKVGDRVYSVHGKKELESTLEMILDSITEVKTDE